MLRLVLPYKILLVGPLIVNLMCSKRYCSNTHIDKIFKRNMNYIDRLKEFKTLVKVHINHLTLPTSPIVTLRYL